jgi:3-oxoacyl-[acyl-carrier-protein] synthase-1
MSEAKRRGAEILGRVAAYAFSSDGENLAVPSGDGLLRCMRECLALGDCLASDVDYISAHATSTPVGDAAEAEAIAAVFGEARGTSQDRGLPWVSSMKSMTGHEMWMAGAAQVVYSVLMARAGCIAPNINFESQEEGVPRLRIAGEAIEAKPRMVLCNSAGFGGTNSCLLLDLNVSS